MNASQVNPAATDLTPPRNFLETIAYKKVNDIALSCFESLVCFFLNIFSCCYPAYERIYDREITRKDESDRNRIETIRTRSTLPSPERVATAPIRDSLPPRLEPRPVATEPPRPRSPINTPPVPRQAEERQRAQRDLESPLVVASPVTAAPVVTATPILRNEKLKDSTIGKIAELRTSDEPHTEDGKPHQYLFIKSLQTQQYHKVIIYRNRDEPIQTYLDLSEGDEVHVNGGDLFLGKKTIIITELNAGKVKSVQSLDLDMPLHPIDYRDPDGEKVYITSITNTTFKHDQKLRQRLSAVLPNLIPVTREPKKTPFLRFGKLFDFTEGAVAALRTSEEKYDPRDGAHEYLTLNGRKVLLYKEGDDDFQTHFDLTADEGGEEMIEKVEIKNLDNSTMLKIELFATLHKNIVDTFSVYPEMFYLRTYKAANGDACTEDVLITNMTDEILGNNEALRQKFSLVWPPVR